MRAKRVFGGLTAFLLIVMSCFSAANVGQITALAADHVLKLIFVHEGHFGGTTETAGDKTVSTINETTVWKLEPNRGVKVTGVSSVFDPATDQTKYESKIGLKTEHKTVNVTLADGTTEVPCDYSVPVGVEIKRFDTDESVVAKANITVESEAQQVRAYSYAAKDSNGASTPVKAEYLNIWNTGTPAWSPTSPTGMYPGEFIHLIAGDPNTGYDWDEWVLPEEVVGVSGGVTDREIIVEVKPSDKPLAFVATYKKQHAITMHGGAGVKAEPAQASKNTTVTLTPGTQTGKVFSHWEVADNTLGFTATNIDDANTFLMPDGPVDITAVFKQHKIRYYIYSTKDTTKANNPKLARITPYATGADDGVPFEFDILNHVDNSVANVFAGKGLLATDGSLVAGYDAAANRIVPVNNHVTTAGNVTEDTDFVIVMSDIQELPGTGDDDPTDTFRNYEDTNSAINTGTWSGVDNDKMKFASLHNLLLTALPVTEQVGKQVLADKNSTSSTMFTNVGLLDGEPVDLEIVWMDPITSATLESSINQPNGSPNGPTTLENVKYIRAAMTFYKAGVPVDATGSFITFGPLVNGAFVAPQNGTSEVIMVNHVDETDPNKGGNIERKLKKLYGAEYAAFVGNGTDAGLEGNSITFALNGKTSYFIFGNSQYVEGTAGSFVQPGISSYEQGVTYDVLVNIENDQGGKIVVGGNNYRGVNYADKILNNGDKFTNLVYGDTVKIMTKTTPEWTRSFVRLDGVDIPATDTDVHSVYPVKSDMAVTARYISGSETPGGNSLTAYNQSVNLADTNILPADLVGEGEKVQYVLSVENPLAVSSAGTVELTYPADGLTIIPEESSVDGTMDLATEGKIGLAVPELEAGASKQYVIVGLVKNPEAKYSKSELGVSADITFGTVTSKASTKSFVMERPVKWIDLDSDDAKANKLDGGIVLASQAISYSIIVKMPAGVATRSVNVIDQLPEGFVATDARLQGKNDRGKIDGNLVVFENIPLTVNSTNTFIITGHFTKDEVADVPNTALVQCGDLMLGTNTVRVSIPYQPKLRAATKDGKDVTNKVLFLKDGEEIIYTVEIKNPAADTETFVITDDFNAENQKGILTPVSAMSAVVDGKNVSNAGKVEGGKVIFTVEVPAGKIATVQYNAKLVKVPTSMALKKNVDVATEGTGYGAKTNDVEHWFGTEPTLAITTANKTNIDKSGVMEGTPLTFTVTFQNPSDKAKEFAASVKIPAGATEIKAANGGTVGNDGTVTWVVKEAAPKKPTTLSVTAIMAPATADKHYKDWAAAVVSKEFFERVSNVTDFAVLKAPVKTGKVGGADINGQFVAKDATVTYTISVHNPSDKEIKATFTDPVPAGLTEIKASDGGSVSGQSVTWKDLALKANENKTVTITGKVSAAAAGKAIDNVASVTVNSTKADSNHVKAFVMTAPEKAVTDSAGKSIDGGTVASGSTVVYSIKVTNPTDAAKDIVITDTLDGHLKASKTTGVVNGQQITWTVKGVRAGASQTVTVEAVVTGENSQVSIPNVATVKIGDAAAVQTNTVTIKVGQKTLQSVMNVPKTGDPMSWMEFLLFWLMAGLNLFVPCMVGYSKVKVFR